MRLNSITKYENGVILSALQNNLSCGIDGIRNRIAKASSFAIVPFLKNSLNYPLSQGVFLKLWLKW